MPDLIKVIDSQTGKLKRYEHAGNHVLAEVNDEKLTITKLGEKHGYYARGLTLMKDGFKTY